MLRTPTKATPRQNHLTQRLCYNQVLTTSCYVLNTELKVKNRMDVNVSAVHPHPRDHDPDWELHVACGHCPTLREKTLPPSASLRKDQNSKHSFYWIYSFWTIKKLKNRKSGTVCMRVWLPSSIQVCARWWKLKEQDSLRSFFENEPSSIFTRFFPDSSRNTSYLEKNV